MKQTAVEWLENQLKLRANDWIEVSLAIEQAKEMEKEQKMNDFIAGMEFIAVDPNRYKEDAEQYYNETYGGEK
jgi:hypothetical protein